MKKSTSFSRIPTCPYCHIPMQKRQGQYGTFWSCPNYPRCPFTLSYPSGTLSSSQKMFLSLIKKRECLCKKYITDIDHMLDSESICTALEQYEKELLFYHSELSHFFSQRKYKNTQTSFDSIVGYVYYRGAKKLYQFQQYEQSDLLLTKSLLIFGDGMLRNNAICLQKKIKLLCHPPKLVNSIPNTTIDIVPVSSSASLAASSPSDRIPPKSNGFLAAHRRYIGAFLTFSILGVLFLFTNGFGLLSTPSKKAAPPKPPITRSVPTTTDTHSHTNKFFISPSVSPSIKSSSHPIDATHKVTSQYIGNGRTGKFHIQGCRAEQRMSESNRIYLNSRDDAIRQGFIPCQICHP